MQGNKMICQICNKEYNESTSSFGIHIKNIHKMSIQEYYNKYLLKNYDELKCKYCGNKTIFINFKNGYNSICNNRKCVILKINRTWNNKTREELDKIDQNRKQTKLKNHGDKNFNNKDKNKKTNLERNGNENYRNVEKNKQTKLKNHGDKNFNNRKKSRETCLERSGYAEHLSNPEVRKNIKETNLRIRGVENPMQDEEIFNRTQESKYKLKPYTLPSSKIIKYQGHEHFFLSNYFSNANNKEEDLIIHPTQNDIKRIWYIKGGKKHRYFPDFYIKSTNTIIEIKSTYTYSKDLKMNLLKHQACLDIGYNFEFYIYDNKGVRHDTN